MPDFKRLRTADQARTVSYRRPPAPPEPAAPPRLLLRPQEAANSLGISLRTLMGLVSAGEIPVCRIGERNLRLPFDGLRAWVAERSTRPAAMVTAEATTDQGDVLQEATAGRTAGNGHGGPLG